MYANTTTNESWTEKYRPKSFDDIVLHDHTADMFSNILHSRMIPNLMLYGPPGTGKTTAILNLKQKLYNYSECRELTIHFNASDDRGIDVVRTQISRFVKSNTIFYKGCKLVILDEVDYMTNIAQNELVSVIEEYAASNIAFILMCNYYTRIDPNLASHFIKVPFYTLNVESTGKIIENVCINENIKFNAENIPNLLSFYHGDIRSIMNYIQLNNTTEIINITTIKRIHSLIVDTSYNKSDDTIFYNLLQFCAEYNISFMELIYIHLRYMILIRDDFLYENMEQLKNILINMEGISDQTRIGFYISIVRCANERMPIHAIDSTNEHAIDRTTDRMPIHAIDSTNEHAIDSTNEHAIDSTNEHAIDESRITTKLSFSIKFKPTTLDVMKLDSNVETLVNDLSHMVKLNCIQNNILIRCPRGRGKSSILSYIQNETTNNDIRCMKLDARYNSNANGIISSLLQFAKASTTKSKIVAIDNFDCVDIELQRHISSCMDSYPSIRFILTTTTIHTVLETVVSKAHYVEIQKYTQDEMIAIVRNILTSISLEFNTKSHITDTHIEQFIKLSKFDIRTIMSRLECLYLIRYGEEIKPTDIYSMYSIDEQLGLITLFKHVADGNVKLANKEFGLMLGRGKSNSDVLFMLVSYIETIDVITIDSISRTRLISIIGNYIIILHNLDDCDLFLSFMINDFCKVFDNV